jgi:hypothetical protein
LRRRFVFAFAFDFDRLGASFGRVDSELAERSCLDTLRLLRGGCGSIGAMLLHSVSLSTRKRVVELRGRSGEHPRKCLGNVRREAYTKRR